jgi:hypothetical protein
MADAGTAWNGRERGKGRTGVIRLSSFQELKLRRAFFAGKDQSELTFSIYKVKITLRQFWLWLIETEFAAAEIEFGLFAGETFAEAGLDGAFDEFSVTVCAENSGVAQNADMLGDVVL